MVVPNSNPFNAHFLRHCLRAGLFLALTTCWMACGSDGDKKIPDVSKIQVDVKIRRFDQRIFSLDTTRVAESMEALGKEYPLMLPLFVTNIIHDQTNPAETPEMALSGFLRAPQVRFLYDTVQQVYGNLDWLEKDLSRMFRFYKYYFPEKPVPEVNAIVSEFATDAFTAGDSLCGIGLDLFLGENYPGYNPDYFPAFIRRQFQKDYISVRLAKALAQNIMEMPPGARLLDKMLHYGKLLYITDCLLPEVHDTLKMGYTYEQLAGCYANEQEVWARLLDQNLLYSTDYSKFRKMVEPSPNAPVIFNEAPGEIGNWLGWQIIKAYMKRFPNTSIKELLAFTDSQKFLEAAKYKPKRI
jgi:hypothetical protein